MSTPGAPSHHPADDPAPVESLAHAASTHEATLARVAAAVDARADFFAPPHDRAAESLRHSKGRTVVRPRC
jgi:hypothetical protein